MNQAVALQNTARQALRCLDLTTLNEGDTEQDVARLCARAQGPFGPVAAVCVWPRLAAFARRELPDAIHVAAVANFPHGGVDVAQAVRDTCAIVDAGAQEVDVVLPYSALLRGDEVAVMAVLDAVRQASQGLLLKVILETGALPSRAVMARAADLSMEAGADFLKTSTGKIPVSATPEAAQVLLDGIAQQDRHGARQVGFKASGGIRTVADAAVYIELTRRALGDAAVCPARLRIGASSLLDDIERVLSLAA